MDWLREFSKNWKLRGAFNLYLSVSLIFSIPCGLLLQVFLNDIKKNFLLSNALTDRTSLLNSLMFSDLLRAMIDFTPIVVIILFFCLFFNLFYKHKIELIFKFLENYEEANIEDQNELSKKVFELVVKNIELKKDRFNSIQKTNELSKKLDTILHEIKNPLAVLSGDMEMLNTIYEPDDERVKRILSRMTRSEKRIQDYVNNLQIGQNMADMELDIRTIKSKDLLYMIKRELDCWEDNLSFRCKLKDLSQKIDLDLERFIEGLVNILKNSKRHAKNQITLSLYENESYLIVEIEDDGLGFSQEALNNYNKPYFSENPLVGNMGLGLYITDEIMKKQGVKMVLSNNVGANTKLFIKKA
ncbi:sensor histidine kinase [Facklamia sp. P12945]|uniref:sensor histidine kinase n=1 Tax=unclassified Facklamia TaxID=2622293 RepID=UPI003D182863